jgi:alanine racemase
LDSESGLEAAVAAAAAAGTRLPVHVKLDTGMHRVGVDPDQLLGFAKAVASAPELDFEGLWTHFAVADEPEDPFTALQLERFEAGRAALRGAGIQPTLLHAANSAGALSCPASRLDFVRAGIACYGYAPGDAVSGLLSDATGGESLWRVLSLKAEVHLVRELAAGERPSYGRRYALGGDHLVATVPLGYADGLPRRYFETGGEVLIRGKRRPLAGSVTMDQIVVDLGSDTAVRAGEEVVLIGRQGDEEITATEWAGRLGTIAYEVLTGIGPRVPRHYVGDDDEASS